MVIIGLILEDSVAGSGRFLRVNKYFQNSGTPKFLSLEVKVTASSYHCFLCKNSNASPTGLPHFQTCHGLHHWKILANCWVFRFQGFYYLN
uniref:Chaperone protein DnaJ isoform X1 n=1 Tax=Rhizophora mucronata TaxID=61149 RepID=A0A2P2LBK8_RHIMU